MKVPILKRMEKINLINPRNIGLDDLDCIVLNAMKLTGWPQSRRKNSLSFPGLSRAINLLFQRLAQQKVNVIMTFIKGHSTSTPAI